MNENNYMEFPNDGWEDYLHYGRRLSKEESDLLLELFIKVMRGDLTHEEAARIRIANGLKLRSE